MNSNNACLRRLITLIIVSGIFFLAQEKPAASGEPERVTLALQWHTQCQFAGYYAALDKGFYQQEGLHVTIKPGATDINPISLVNSGIADFGTKWLADFISAIDRGLPLISLSQVVQSNGLVMIAKTTTNIKTPQDFIGKRLGIWLFGNEVQFYTLMNALAIPLDQMQISPLKWSVKPFLDNELDVIMAMRYNEYLTVLDSGYDPTDINIIDFATYQLNFPGQVLFTQNKMLHKRPDLCERMVRASLRGWDWAMKHPEEAVNIVLSYDDTKRLEKHHQLRQLKTFIELINYGGRPLGYHDPEQVAFVLQSLQKNKILSRAIALTEIYTNSIWEKAGKFKD